MAIINKRSALAPVAGLLAALMAGSAPAHGDQPKSSEASTEAASTLAQANNQFGLELLGKLGPGHRNLVISPFSVATALAMVSAGARGATAEEMTAALHLNELVDPHAAFAELSGELAKTSRKGQVDLHSASSLWLQRGSGFVPTYLETVRSRYGAAAEEVDFAAGTEAARQTINTWADRATRGKIPTLLPTGALLPSTRLVLANTVYFKGSWARRFDAKDTALADFHLRVGRTAQVPLMHQIGKFRYLKAATFQAVELPYRGDDLSLVVLLPEAIEGLARLEASLTEERLAKVVRSLEMTEVDLFLPRFEAGCDLQLAHLLAQAGMPLVFGSQADLSGISEREQIALAAVLHHALIAVDEEGTEAAAASAAVTMSALRRPVVFRADHPFLFLIRYAPSGHILFLGQLTDPTAESASAG